MNGVHHNGKNCDFERTYTGCLGRMTNLFELNIGVSANRLLNDKPHQGGPPLSRNRSDVSRMSPSGDPAEEKEIVSDCIDSSPNRISNGTPMKMLIAQEMSAEADSRLDPPNLVAKLMGIDALPQQESGSVIQRSNSKVHPRSSLDIPRNYSEQQNGLLHYMHPKEYVHGRCQQSQKSLYEGAYEETVNDRKMNLVRQKFSEAKCLSMDGKLPQSKQFEDALDVLSSNKDVFLKCLQEPNSVFPQHLYGPQSVHPPSETKRITVLRPSKIASSNDLAGARYRDEKQIKRGTFVRPNKLEKIHSGSSPAPGFKYDESSSQPTRIVVLKPDPGKLHNVEPVGSPQSDLPKILLSEEFFGEDEANDEYQESREVAKAITQRMREELGGHSRDENLISSEFSNGYTGDESSSSKSEIESADGDPSDSKVISPVSSHSWDYADRIDSPCSSSSFTRASYSRESSVCREAKKRLSKRWTMMASNGSRHEQIHFQRSSSTLRDMLALFETKKEASSREGGCYEEPKNSDAHLVNEQRMEDNMDYSPRNLMRSKSVPVSYTEFGTRLNVGTSVSDKRTPELPKEGTKENGVKSSFREKLSSLFFSRNKKTGKTKSLVSETENATHSFLRETCSDNTGSLREKGLGCASPGPLEPSLIAKLDIIPPEAVAEPIASGNTCDICNQPSPISVLGPPLEENELTVEVLPHRVEPHDQHGIEMSLNYSGSNLVDKSPPIGSIARTLSWDNPCVNRSLLHPVNESVTAQKTYEERECCIFVKTLLSMAGLQGEMQSTSCLARWHSPESPLDPSLRNKYFDDLNGTWHEAKQQQKSSIQKLVFDWVNEVLIAGYESEWRQRASGPGNCILDEVWAGMKVWFSGLDKCASGDSNLVVERVVGKEVVGKGWNGNFRSEMDHLGMEIGGELLEELVQEAVVEFTGRESDYAFSF